MADMAAGASQLAPNKLQRQVQVTEVKNGFILGGYNFGESEVYLTLDEVKARLDIYFAPENAA